MTLHICFNIYYRRCKLCLTALSRFYSFAVQDPDDKITPALDISDEHDRTDVGLTEENGLQ